MTTPYYIEDLLGYHCDKSNFSGYEQFVSHMLTLPIGSAQIYISNPRGYGVSAFSSDDVNATRRLVEGYKFRLFVHGCLLYNLYGTTDKNNKKYYENLNKTIASLSVEMDLASGLGAQGVVVHIGSAKDKNGALERVAKSIELALSNPSRYTKKIADAMCIKEDELISRRRVILENSAGEGNKLGRYFEEIRDIINFVDPKLRDRVHVCIDTAHTFGAGAYNLRETAGMKLMLDTAEKYFGDKLVLIHLNDSEQRHNSRKDSHANLFCGFIFGGSNITTVTLDPEIHKIGKKKYYEFKESSKGKASLRVLLEHAKKRDIAVVLETPVNGVDKDGKIVGHPCGYDRVQDLQILRLLS